MMRKVFFLLITISILLVPALLSAQNGAFSAVQMHPQAMAFARAQQKPIKSPTPASANQGRKFDPGGATVGQLTTAGSQKVLVIFIAFQTPPAGGPVTHVPLSYFDNMLFGTTYDPPEYAVYKSTESVPSDRTL